MSAFVVAGRSIANFRNCHRTVPSDAVVRPCMVCGQDVAISPEGAARLRRAENEGHSPVGAMCTECTVAVANQPDGIEKVEMSEHGKAELARRPGDAGIIEFLRSRVKP